MVSSLRDTQSAVIVIPRSQPTREEGLTAAANKQGAPAK